MEVIPAMDLKGGKCVRLKQGLFDQVTTYDARPLEMALRFQKCGARRLHIIDLDGAESGNFLQKAVVKEVLDAIDLPVQLGGGIRSLGAVAGWLDLGVDRVIISTLAVTSPDEMKKALAAYGGKKIILSVDAKDGWVAVKGWQETTRLRAADLALQFKDAGLERLLYTDIARDGMFTGPNLEATKALAQATGMRVIASGGVSTKADLEAVAALEPFGVDSVVVGKAFYEGRIKPEEVFRAG